MRKKKGDWHWIEKTCGVSLPRIPFRKMVSFVSEFLEFLFLVKTSSDDNRGIPGRGLFFQKKHVPFQKNTHIEVFGVKHIKLGVIFEIVYQERSYTDLYGPYTGPFWC